MKLPVVLRDEARAEFDAGFDYYWKFAKITYPIVLFGRMV